MFKLESYITPIILSYVNRYINNLKLEDTNVSLWGGDATFHNLELNLEVLEEELQLPFSFVSGNIRELSIHVPWTKITSEPIKITINTIECILNLKGKGPVKTPQRKKSNKEKKVPGQHKNVEAPPGYIQSLINKIVSNICVYCNNLILKYVEEDIVLSMNVRLLKFEGASDKWESAYTDLSLAHVILRKIISVNDLTLCLDKRNASGKIEVYQEPMLYRCSMTIHLLKNYHSATANKASTTRLDIYCNNMEFSMTEQQVPMLMRLLMLLYALQQKQLKSESCSTTDTAGPSSDCKSDNPENAETWTGWAWSYVSSVLPAPWELEWDDDENICGPSGHTLQIGLYVDRATITFKVSESSNDKSYYQQKKLRYYPMLTLDLQGIYSDTIIHGLTWFNCTGGVSEATLFPAGHCSCGSPEVNESTAPYLKIGAPSNCHKSDSLFDVEAVENKGGQKVYNTSWDHHMITNTESVLLERTPAFAYDYVYQIVVPEDVSSDILSEMGSNYEFSNLTETSALRICLGPLRLRICSGLFHRFSTLQMASSFYDYPPYYVPKPHLSLQELLPPSEDDFDALMEFIPSRSLRVTFFAPQIELDLMDHPFFEPSRCCLSRRSKKHSTSNMPTSSSTLPKITIECQFIDISTQYPMYADRLVHTTCQLPEPPMQLFEACYSKRTIKIVGLFSRLVVNPMCQSIILTPSSISYSDKSILKPHYWTNPDIPHNEIVLESESITLNGTKAKMLVVYNIIEKMLQKEPDPVGKSIYSSSLLTDACRDFGLPYMEICVEGIRFKKVVTNSTQTMDMSLESIKAFIFESVDSKASLRCGRPGMSTDIQQVLFVSGPEGDSVDKESSNTRKSFSDNPPLLTAIIQFPLDPNVQQHPPILLFNLREIRICVDPLLCKWLLYVPKNFLLNDLIDSPPSKLKTVSDASGSAIDTPRKFSTHQIESVHSSSDRDQKAVRKKSLIENLQTEDLVDAHEKVYTILKTWFDVWKGMYLCGDISQCSIYFPTVSLSAVGSQGIQEAVENTMNKENPPDIMVITLPFANIRSVQRQIIKKHLTTLPVTLPDNVWSIDKSSFPWTMSVSDLSCYTIQHGNKLIFLKPVTLSATVGLSTRPSKANVTADSNTDVSQTVKNTSQDELNVSNVTSQTQKRKGSRNTNLSASSAINTPFGKNSDSTAPSSPNNQIKSNHSLDWQSQNSCSAQCKSDIGYLGVCVHIDMTPVVVSTSEVQVYLFASILYGLMEVAQNLIPLHKGRNSGTKTVPHDVVPHQILTKESTTLSPTILKEDDEHSSQRTPPLNTTVSTEVMVDEETVKLTAWVQWTITRFTVELFSSQFKSSSKEDEQDIQPRLKLVLDVEDIVSSLDFQSVYLKIKSKIGSGSIRHYERSSPTAQWVPGPFSGIVMRVRDDFATNPRQEDNGLISVVITRASCQHTHTLWGAVRKKHKDKKEDLTKQILSKSRYITEIVVNIQPLDFIISLSTLRSFYLVLIPLLNIPVKSPEPEKCDSVSSTNFLNSVNNQTLPLAYLECQDIRVIMPSSELIGNGSLHDVMVFQLQKVTLNPQAVNPICRAPIRTDLYERAAHARILNIPGSEVEDRQYQLDLLGISLCSGVWDEINSVLHPKESSLSDLRGMSENPALEWNILEQGQPNTAPTLNLRCIIEKFNVSVIAAPAMTYKDNVIICGHAMEINFVSDIFVNLSLHQIKIVSGVLAEFVVLLTPLIMEDGLLKRPKIKFPYSRFESFLSEFDTEKEVAVIDGLNKDSGIETSDVKSLQSARAQTFLNSKPSTESEKQNIFPRPPNTVPYLPTTIPLEVLITSGKITLSLYSVDDERNVYIKYKGKKKKSQKKADEDQGYEASEESTDDKTDNYKKYIPLIYVSFTQPNAFFVKQQIGRKLQLSCFDINFKLSGPEYTALNHMPNETDFPVNLLETKPGTPNSNGILPAFFVLKFIKGVGKKSKIELDISKPTKVLCKTSKWSHMLAIKDKVVDTFNSGGGGNSFMVLLKAHLSNKKNAINESQRSVRVNDTYSKFQEIKEFLGNTNSVSVNFDQIVFAVSSESGHELHIGMQKLKSHLSLNTRPEKLCLATTFECLTLTVIHDVFKKLLLNPWTVTVDVCVFWESWQDTDSNPQVQVSIESDCILLDATAEHLKCVEMVLKDVKEFISMLPNKDMDEVKKEDSFAKIEKDQYYKDDLRAGAFQFVDSSTDNSDEMPLPYQVMFWSKTISAMAWKYPQPRALTKVRVFPVPYKMALGSQESVMILCHLEYWSECRNCYLPYTEFYLSESEVCHLNLPKGQPQKIVASVWRVVITAVDDQSDENIPHKIGISPRALAACMRIDSYFNKSLIPNLTTALYITKIEVALYNYFPKNENNVKLPKSLKKYSSDFSFPENQRFLTLTVDNLCSYLSTWNFDIFATEITGALSSNVLDYAFLTEQNLLETFTCKLELFLNKGLECNIISKPIRLNIAPSIAHTLAVSSQMWTRNSSDDANALEFVIVTRFVICNDTNASIRFAQWATEEDILLPSRKCNLYSWRSQKKHQYLRVAIEETDWIWSKAFSISQTGNQVIHFNSEKNITLFVSVKELSKTQKQITFYGQLIVYNLLSEHFEMKIVEAVAENKEAEFKSAQVHIAAGKTAAPSIFINDKKSYFLRLRFYGLESSWTGDIPLREHATGSQPWLVKVPLQERGQFLSIWCRIFVQDISKKTKRILAMLWPLFMVKSNLPMHANVHIETPTLKVHLDSVVNGKGELQQLYCPGTVDHSHQITFKLETGNCNTNNPYVPLNYSLVDQQKFFKKTPSDDLEVILDSLESCFESKWPYFGDELDDIEWIVDDNQPLTHVQVRYQNACQHSCALLVELLPWCLMVNTLGTPVSVMLNGVELCKVQHHGIIAPPKLEETFHLGVLSSSKLFFSGPLQLAKSDWSQSFYMPKISGTIPIDGTIKTCIKCDQHLCMVSITSLMSNEIRLLRLSSTHVLSNHLSTQVHIVCLAVPDCKESLSLPLNLEKYCFTVAPHLQKSHCGIPIVQWYIIKSPTETPTAEYNLYMTFSVDPKVGWSCPVRVDKHLVRKSFSVQTKQFSIPVVLTAQENKGQVYLAIHNDPRPQIFIENKTSVAFFCGQSLPDDSGIVKEAEHIRWTCKVGSMSRMYYNLPVLSEKFPELPQVNFSEKLSLGYSEDEKEIKDIEWSAGVSIVNNNSLFTRVPYYGDVKLTINNTACTTFVTIESGSQVEISARDIRVRLSMRQTEKNLPVNKSKKPLEPPKKNSDCECREQTATTTPFVKQPSFQVLPTVSEQTNASSSNQIHQHANVDETVSSNFTCERKSFLANTISLKEGWNSAKFNVYIQSFFICLLSDTEEEGKERWEICNLVCDDIIVNATQTEQLTVKFAISDIQFDNQLCARESYDFPVILVGQEQKPNKKINILNMSMENLLQNFESDPMHMAEFVLEAWRNESNNKCYTGIRSMKIYINPVSCFIEDIFITKLMQQLQTFNILDLVLWPDRARIIKPSPNSNLVNVSELVSWQCAILAQPLTIRCFSVSPVSLLLSVHSSVKMYIALDQSPLQFSKFERRRIFTTPYRLGHALTMHYLSGAIFGAGWVVSSLELLGSPGGLARAMGTGLRDFVSLPYRGLVQGPMAFLKGITTGSASLMRHVTAGTLQSVTKLASSVARNLDRLTLDEEHQKRAEEQRRQRPMGVAQGFMQGLTNFGISLLGAVGGIAHHPLQSVMSEGASPRSLVAGVGLGIVGVFTKPLSGAAELVAMTGQGLLQGAGWNSLPNPRRLAQVQKIHQTNNSTLKYSWKFITLFTNQMLYVTEATMMSSGAVYATVAVILTTDSVIIINLEGDEVYRAMSLKELSVVSTNDPTVLSLKHTRHISMKRDLEKVDDELAIPMDPEMRARVAAYVRSTVGLLNLPEVNVYSEITISPLSSPVEDLSVDDSTVVNLYMTAHKIKYFVCLFNLARRQIDGNHFAVL
ncbi:vacuolar protein sorting-associated protein 13B-like isoform X2 [Sitophilus oryzae]|uniref:Vacuolar protein sorting-associated protein 13B-like isoform X2 n=1 Tax=Sitophilus oryzae TaxID=7048 RepID=A0A6J2YZT7_SITOR|nr:vacuolar protein sorting-associated protein 13B-like isoform X2 [Sitophilus oryzae]